MKLDGALGHIRALRGRPGWPVLLALLVVTVLDDLRAIGLTVYEAFRPLQDFPVIGT